jgi:hypothetical protein
MRPQIAIAAAVLVLAGCGDTPSADVASTSTTSPAVTSPAPAPEPVDEPEPTPDGTYSWSCDYLLDFDAGHEFVATAFVTNTGGIDAKIEVVATWRQSGHDPITKKKATSLPADAEDMEVNISRAASSKEIDRIQAIDDPDKQCAVEVTIIG